MDVTDAFDSEIGTKPYSNIATLHELLSKFSRVCSLKFFIKEFSLFCLNYHIFIFRTRV